MDNLPKIAVYIPDEEAQKFLLFQRYYEQFSLLVDSGVFDVRNGSVVLHYDKSGGLMAINRADVLYSKRHSLQ
tara:strand:- start:11671 stop:11889 length:219 start_codon:yes stop_codon:yes gene_type:complete